MQLGDPRGDCPVIIDHFEKWLALDALHGEVAFMGGEAVVNEWRFARSGIQMPNNRIIHHGAIDGVTGSCHELLLGDGRSILIDCGLFQGAETSSRGARFEQLQIDFPVASLLARRCWP